MSVAGSANADVPIGVVLPYGGFIAPKGGFWLLCDGSVFDPVEYSVLYGVIGTTFGGTATAPLLPSMGGKYGLGYQAGVNSVGQSIAPTLGGTQTFTLTANNIPTLSPLDGNPTFTVDITQPVYTQSLNASLASPIPSDLDHEMIPYLATAQQLLYTTTTTGATITYTNPTPSAFSQGITATSIAYGGYDMTFIIKAKGF
jgi:microcystin-dependent protein